MNTEKRAISRAFRAYEDFMRLDASANEIIKFIHTKAFRGCDWRGSTKSSMAQSWAIWKATASQTDGKIFDLTIPPYEELLAEFGKKRKF